MTHADRQERVKATFELRQRPTAAAEPVLDGVENGSDRDRRRRVSPAMLGAVMVIVTFATGLAWSLVGDSGAQLVETSTVSPMTAPRAGPAGDLAGVGQPRNALVVDVGDPGSGSGVEVAEPSGGKSGGRPDGDPRSRIESGVAPASGSAPDSSTIAPASPVTTDHGSSPEATAGAVGRSSAGSPAAPTPVPATSTSASTSNPTATSPASAVGVAWEEHFNSLDTGRWEIEHSTYGDGNGERQCYQPENVRVADGRLVLTARAETVTCPNGDTRSVSSGMVRSRGLTFSPGQAIEFRVKLTPPDPSNQAGLWPAVWASSWAGSWPRGGELDFLEVMTAEDSRRAVFSMHYADRSGGHRLQNQAVPMPDHFSSGWHTIRFDYGHNGDLVWFLDGSRAFSVSAADTAQGYPAPFDRAIDEIKVNLAVGGTPGPLASGALGATGASFEIDYIKVFDL